jgi:hypothetical protein
VRGYDGVDHEQSDAVGARLMLDPEEGTGRGDCRSRRAQRSRELGVFELWQTPGAQGQFMDERLRPAILQAAIDASVALEWLSQTSMSRPPCGGP